jgi:AAA domain-containing protein
LDRFLTIEDLSNLPEPKWLIEGLFEQDALVMLVGPPGSFKSFLAIDWALCLASGRPWSNRPTKAARVLYALGEGKASLLKRIQAWMNHNRLTKQEYARLHANFRVTFEVPQLAIPRETGAFLEDLDRDGFNPTLLVIDTLARSYVGKNENDPMDAGVWVESVDKLRQRGMTVLVLHHTKKNAEFGLKYRGTTAFLGAMDTSFVLERNPEGYKGLAKLSCDKQKDHQEPEDVWMQHQHIRPREGVEGSIVLVETGKPGEQEEELKEAENAALQAIIDSLIVSPEYKSDRARARALAEQANLPESTAQTKIHRARKHIINIEVNGTHQQSE